MAAQPQPSRSTRPWCISLARGYVRAKQLMGWAMEVDAERAEKTIFEMQLTTITDILKTF